MSYATQFEQPVFGARVRWAIRVLAWLAFAAAAKVAWHAVNQTHVAGCGVGSQNGCDVVLSSKWSTWLGLPVAVAGLACYAALAGLSVILGLRDPRWSRWIDTALVMLSMVAAVASLWFVGIQVFAIGSYCRYCMVADICGLALGALALWSTVRWMSATRGVRTVRNSNAGLMALRSALPTARGAAPIVAPRSLAPTPASPSIPIAVGGASALLVLLIGGQLLLPAKTFDVQKLALNETIEMSATGDDRAGDPAPSMDAEPRVAMRVPADPLAEPDASREGAASSEPTTTPDQSSVGASPPRGSRVVKFLGGKLPLDVYKHPLLGSPEAPHVLVEMVSYDCPHCRKTHRVIKQAQARYGDQVAIIIVPVPLEKGCNRLIVNSAASHPGACTTARMAIGVAKLKPEVFPKFHDWLMAAPEKPPALDSIITKAYGLVDRTRLRELSRGDELNKQVEQYVNLFATLQQQNASKKEFGLPIQIIGDNVMSGAVEKAEDIYKAWEEQLGVKPR